MQLSLFESSWTVRVCLERRLAAAEQAVHWAGAFPEGYVRATMLDEQGARHRYRWTDMASQARTEEVPAWRCPYCWKCELSVRKLALHHGVVPGDPASWTRPCWHTTQDAMPCQVFV